MSSGPLSVNSTLAVENACDQYESALRAGTSESLHAFVRNLRTDTEAKREFMIRSLLAIEWDYRDETGDPFELEDYLRQELLPPAKLQLFFADWQNRNRADTTIGSFRLVERLGAGNFGTVWRAIDTVLDRSVAIKIAHPNSIGNADAFLREARAAADLHHPNIAGIVFAGEWNERPYIVREYVDGETLGVQMKRERISPFKAARICSALARALDYSHRQGCIHRDLKPGNILIRPNGIPMIIDFGLAKTSQSGLSGTRSGTIMGTPVYMAPEQARGDSQSVDARTDVYSLGVILYEMLTANVPFDGNFEATMHQVLSKRPKHPRAACPDLPDDLATICLKCLEKSPKSRFSSGAELADDLERFLTGERVKANRAGPITRMATFSRENPAIALLCTALILVLATSALVASRSASMIRQAWQEERELRENAVDERRNALAAAERAREEARFSRDMTTFLESLFAPSDPIGSWIFGDSSVGMPDVSMADLLDQAAAKLDSDTGIQPRLRARLLDILCGVNCNLGRYAESQYLATKSEEIRNEIRADLPRPHFDRDEAIHYYQRGKLNQSRGEYQAAADDLQRSTELLEAAIPSDDLQLADIVFQQGWLYLDWKRPAEAERHFKRALEIREQWFDEHHQLIWITKLGIALCHVNEDTDLYRVGEELASTLGDAEVADLLFTAVKTQIAKTNKDYELAIQLHQKLLEGLQKRLPKQNPIVVLAQGDYAGTLRSAGDYRQAFSLIVPAIAIGRRVAPQHPELMRVYWILGYEMMLAKRYPEAEQWLLEALADRHGTIDRSLQVRLALAETWIEMKSSRRAHDTLTSIDESTLSPERRPWFEYLMGKTESELGNLSLAERRFENARRLCDQLDPSAQHPTTVDRMVRIRQETGDAAVVESLLRLALAKEIAIRPESHPRVADRLTSLGIHLIDDRPQEARELLVRASEICHKRLPPDDLRTAMTDEALATAMRKR